MHRDLLLFLSVLGIAAAKAWAQPFARWRLSYLLLVVLHLWIPVPLLEGQKNLSSTVQKAGANADMNAEMHQICCSSALPCAMRS